MKIFKENEEFFLENDNSEKFNFKENFEEISKMLILSDENLEGLEKLKDTSLKNFISKFMECKKQISEEKIKEEIERETGYKFDIKN